MYSLADFASLVTSQSGETSRNHDRQRTRNSRRAEIKKDKDLPCYAVMGLGFF